MTKIIIFGCIMLILLMLSIMDSTNAIRGNFGNKHSGRTRNRRYSRASGNRRYGRRTETSTDNKKFEEEKKKLYPNCSEEEFDKFVRFLKNYGGGYVKKKR